MDVRLVRERPGTARSAKPDIEALWSHLSATAPHASG
jgi:hypothetical protein